MCECEQLLKQKACVQQISTLKSYQPFFKYKYDNVLYLFKVVAVLQPDYKTYEAILKCNTCGRLWALKYKVDRRGQPVIEKLKYA